MNDVTPPPGMIIPPGMTYHELPAGEETLEFWGEFIDRTDTDVGNDRWAELQYWLALISDPEAEDFGEKMRLIYTIGHSLVYHRFPDGCGKGRRMKGADFEGGTTEDPESLVPCETCRPADFEEFPEREYRLEVTWYSYTPCYTPEEAIRALSRCANCRDKPHDGACYRCGCTTYAGTLTVPGRILVDQVKARDPELGQAAARTKRF